MKSPIPSKSQLEQSNGFRNIRVNVSGRQIGQAIESIVIGSLQRPTIVLLNIAIVICYPKNHITSFNISTMRHWDSPAAMPVETLAGQALQSRPHNIIPYIHNETLGQSSSNGLDVVIRTVTDWALIGWGHKNQTFCPLGTHFPARGDPCWPSIPIQTT
eukprot:scaffold14260_cov33-Cyclotella_meneghiniana.AAC.1